MRMLIALAHPNCMLVVIIAHAMIVFARADANCTRSPHCTLVVLIVHDPSCCAHCFSLHTLMLIVHAHPIALWSS